MQQLLKDNGVNSQKKQTQEQEKVDEHILRRFDLIELKGKGAYGIVWKAMDRKSKEIVALKKIFDAFQNATDAQRSYRELIFLEQLTHHENIISIKNVIKAENNKDLYMVFDFMETDLHKVIRAKILEPIHWKYIIYQLLKAIKYIHSGDLIHRDLKPANLLIDSECKLKVADFGLARTVSSWNENNAVMTEYVATRWYRAPEILLGSKMYSKSVDMWSVGCILGEMITGKVIFPGTSTLNQIELIIELIGRPINDDLYSIQSPLALNILLNLPTKKKKCIAEEFEGGGEDSIDFIKKCFVYNPKRRMTVEQALNHPFVNQFKGTEEEIVKESIIETYIDDNHKFSVEEYKHILYRHLRETKNYDRKKIISRNLSQVQHHSTNNQIYNDVVNILSPSKQCEQEIQQRNRHLNDSNQLFETKKENEDIIVSNNQYNQFSAAKQFHQKSSSYISPQYIKKSKYHQSSQSIFSISQSQIIKKKSKEQKYTSFIQLPNADKQLPSADKWLTKMVFKQSSIEKKLRSTISPISQINNNCFLSGEQINFIIQQNLGKKKVPIQSQNNCMVKNISPKVNKNGHYFHVIKNQNQIVNGNVKQQLPGQYTIKNNREEILH